MGINCHFDPFVTVQGLRLMKAALDREGIKVHLIAQPLAFHTPDAGKQGFIDLPEFPFGMFSLLCWTGKLVCLKVVFVRLKCFVFLNINLSRSH